LDFLKAKTQSWILGGVLLHYAGDMSRQVQCHHKKIRLCLLKHVAVHFKRSVLYYQHNLMLFLIYNVYFFSLSVKVSRQPGCTQNAQPYLKIKQHGVLKKSRFIYLRN